MDSITQLIHNDKKTAIIRPQKRAIVSRKIVSTTDRPKTVRPNKAVKSEGCNTCAARKMARLQNAQVINSTQSEARQ